MDHQLREREGGKERVESDSSERHRSKRKKGGMMLSCVKSQECSQTP